ncbi:hypothetical protein D9757_001341 [Collybiopsis confluens]|uniref:Uncharacterized protein n=1 Tax=Collybiopsis confluens TaxID=2823264 RepID=A0A8H5I0W0_9AGAR|nr:hypothetical protein D9757_001341 [Collybiopsis confluens]
MSATAIGLLLLSAIVSFLYSWKQHTEAITKFHNITFLSTNVEDGQPVAIPDQSPAVVLTKAVFHALSTSNQLVAHVDIIYRTIAMKIRHFSVPSHAQNWQNWLTKGKINVVFSPYINQTKWGWVQKEETSEQELDYTMRVLDDLVNIAFNEEFTDATYHVSQAHFKFCFAVTVLRESIHLLTKYAFPYQITPVVPGTILHSGEAGYGFEHAVFEGKLVCEWDEGKVSELKHLQRLLVRKHFDGVEHDFELSDEEIHQFLDKLCNTSSNTTFSLDTAGHEPSVTPLGRIRTANEAERQRAAAGILKKPVGLSLTAPAPGTERTGTMLGDVCYDRRPWSRKHAGL